MSDEKLLPVGTRIRFTEDLEEGATCDHPPLSYAQKGQTGTITGHGTWEGYWAKTDTWPNAFGAKRSEFEVVG